MKRQGTEKKETQAEQELGHPGLHEGIKLKLVQAENKICMFH